MKQGSIHLEFAGQDNQGNLLGKAEIEEDEVESPPEICCHTLIDGSVKVWWSWGE